MSPGGDDAVAVLVAGGGPVGATLSLALAGAGLTVAMVEAPASTSASGDADRRPIALSASSVRILDTLGVWPNIAPHACPIDMVHVSESGRLGMVRLRAKEQGVAALGHVTDAAAIAAALVTALAKCPGLIRVGPARVIDAAPGATAVTSRLQPAMEAPPARLLVVADGGVSPLRENLGMAVQRREYGQRAVVCTVVPGREHAGVAYERFTASGPVALLPMLNGECAVVWTLPENLARDVVALDEAGFLAALQHTFGGRLGRLSRATPRQAFALALIQARPLAGQRVVLVGNAAHQLHPVAGQGLNLGLRDAAALADEVAAAVRSGQDPGAPRVLDGFTRGRSAEQRAVVHFTDLLARGFSVHAGPLGMLRSALMLGLDLVPPAGRALARRAMGLSGRQPRLVRGVMP